MTPASQAGSLFWLLVVQALKRPKFLLLATFGGFILGYLLSWLIPPQYKAIASVAVDETSLPSNVGALGSLVARIGGTVGSRAESPPFIAALFRSAAGLLPVLDKPMPTVSGSTQDLIRHYRIDTTGRRPSEVQQRALRRLRARIDASFDRETGIVSLSVKDRDPVTAAAVADSLIVSVNSNTIARRKSQYAALRQYTEGRVADARDSLGKAERDLTTFLTLNRAGLQTPALAAERARLEREVSHREQTYSSATDQLEFARFNEARTTPVISVVDQPLVPFRRAWPPRRLFAIFGFFVGLGAVIIGAAAEVYQVRRVWDTWRSKREVSSAKVA